MKHYPKRYEDVFSSEKEKKRCPLGDVTIRSKQPTADFIDRARKEMFSISEMLWKICVLFTWTAIQFEFRGYKRLKRRQNGTTVDHAFSVFFLNHIGYDYHVLGNMPVFSKLRNYVEEFYPDIADRDPRENEEYFRYPFSHVSVDFLMLVYQMPERMELLEIAEKQKMTAAEFRDYVINHTYSVNEEAGEDLYVFMKMDRQFHYVRYRDFADNLFPRKRRKILYKKNRP